LRATQARETRRRIVDSARTLFLEQGYARTTVAAVAREAAVSTDTVFAVFGTKLGVLKAVLDTTVGGDDRAVPFLQREGPQAMRAEPDQRRQLELFAAGIATQLERVAPVDQMLRGAAAVDAEAAALREDLQQRQRRRAMRTVVGWLAANGPLREGLSEPEATSVVWTLTSPEVYQMLRGDSRWSRRRYERWLRETLESALLPVRPGAAE
jgi:AcrR family transcriptional regulator